MGGARLPPPEAAEKFEVLGSACGRKHLIFALQSDNIAPKIPKKIACGALAFQENKFLYGFALKNRGGILLRFRLPKNIIIWQSFFLE